MINNDLTNKHVIHIKNETNEYLQFKKLLKYNNIISHAYSVGIKKSFRTIEPNMEKLPLEIYEENFKNYRNLCKELNLNENNLIRAKQAHTDNILCLNDLEKEDTIDSKEIADGLITNKKKFILATTNADCILLLMFDPVKKVIANVHSGWKGTLQEISVKTINEMKGKYGCNTRDIIVCICPSIRKCHFEVGEDVKELFYNQFKKLADVEKFIKKENDKWYVDTVLINKIILKQAGILERNIEDSGICSVCNCNQIHSFRAEGEGYGLCTAIISLI